MTRSLYVASGLLLVLLLARCDSAVTPPPPGEEEEQESPRELTPAGEVTLTVNGFQIPVDSSGGLGEGDSQRTRWHPAGYPSAEGVSTLYSAGIWLVATQDGQPRASLHTEAFYPRSNFMPEIDGVRTGIFKVTADLLREPIANWPAELGAPVDAQGQPRLYGDAMTWTALASRAVPDKSVLAAPLQQIRVTQAVYGYTGQQNTMLRDVLFVRYEVTNLSGATLSDLHAGFYTDTDLWNGIRDCPQGGAAYNSTGYLAGPAVSYTYNVNDRGDARHEGCPAVVAGFTFLEVAGATSAADLVASHRIIRKADGTTPGFGEAVITQPAQVMMALQGLSSTGAPMIDPTTGTQTKFAFTGDPVAETGWLDGPLGIDVRSLLAAHPFSLAPGETKTITVLLTAGWGDRLSAALEHLNTQVDYVRSHPDLWQF